MNRRTRRQFLRGSLALTSLSLISGCGLLPSQARPSALPVIGHLSVAAAAQTTRQSLLEAFQQGLRELGYVEGQNIHLERRRADGLQERLPELAAELVGLQVSIIYASDGPAALAARTATETIPIVSTTTDPVGLGLAASLARPGGNVTGMSYASALLGGKKLQLLKEVSPTADRVVVLWYAPNAASAIQVRETQEASQQLGIQLHLVGVQGPDSFESAFESAANERADAFFVINSPQMSAQLTRVVQFVGGTRLPAMYGEREWAERGGLMAYGVDMPDVHRRAATHVDKILKGARPGDLPIEQPTKFDFVINLKTAQAIGLTIPQPVLAQATEIIQ